MKTRFNNEVLVCKKQTILDIFGDCNKDKNPLKINIMS